LQADRCGVQGFRVLHHRLPCIQEGEHVGFVQERFGFVQGRLGFIQGRLERIQERLRHLQERGLDLRLRQPPPAPPPSRGRPPLRHVPTYRQRAPRCPESAWHPPHPGW